MEKEKNIMMVNYHLKVSTINHLRVPPYKKLFLFWERWDIISCFKIFKRKKKFYINGKLLFEGEYLNDKRNGKGKDYLKGELIFEGEYKNGKRWNGKAKIYRSCHVEFEGEYLNGKKWKGKSYDKNGNLLSEIKDGCGLIREFEYKDGYEGEYLNGERTGKGKI